MNFSNILGLNEFNFVVLKTNNFCNLSCEYCNNFCNYDIRENSKKIYMQKPYNIDLDDVIQYCEVFKGVGEEDTHRLSGGEPTMLDEDLLTDVIDVLYGYGRRIELLTNGYGVFDLDRRLFAKVDQVSFDKHNINNDHVDECIRYLRSFYHKEIDVLYLNKHNDLRVAMKHPQNAGRSCGNWLTTLTLYKKVIFPCCVTFPLMLYNNDNVMYEELEKNGWTIDNNNIVEVMKDFQNTIPEYVIDSCLYNCWNPNYNVAPSKIITRKPKDIIKK